MLQFSSDVALSLDKRSEDIVNRIIQTRFRHHTVISVAHKLDFALGFDGIVVMDAGRVVEFDGPEALLSRASLFKEMYESQVRNGGSSKHMHT